MIRNEIVFKLLDRANQNETKKGGKKLKTK